ncbi:MAG: twin-arginine translocase TatA/TatE family subunit [Flavobacteriaceae bacterium]|jgi:sec-independent protein translocase protein TatA|nr:twin-arginine translocase TatA/TatE family subunit [Flavobacteriaceae bacterium]MDC0389340.1 twin-arginine translocase TatA/TatE family subunit [Flavobacteriaceae bacterium]MDG1052289.1 twin-arginine translocase TatA/TatE family subunit [Flavobacteriaceae bacterium]MDG1973650.1 twin-arginine translocase TatA/TatE family subunit [Flavobacteriaceae bacterium]MDG2368079.1 twin-arginine translocase TatA/TatE family subunit [Flavobacteriaceae bacterium]|tara:strand:+ start:122 stop:385 length:264 start_codon:yes stop_codon:yes gene_type:complete
MLLFISGPEILFIGLIVLLVFGADKIPEISKGLGKGIRVVKDATEEVKSEIKKSAKTKGVDTESLKKDIDSVKDSIEDLGGSIKRNL